MTYLKKLIGTKFQQDYLRELFPIVPLNIHRKPWKWGGEGVSHPTAKNALIYLEMYSFTQETYFTIKSVIPLP